MKRVLGMSVKKERDVVGLDLAAVAVLVLMLYCFGKLRAGRVFRHEGMWQC
jgi:hypothetical protein